MNDFTKEELLQIKFDMDNNDSRYSETFTGKQYQDLEEKIQSMIDNYCEHDYRSVGNHPWLHCIKCKSNFNFTETPIC